MNGWRLTILWRLVLFETALLFVIAPLAYLAFRNDWNYSSARNEQRVHWGRAADLAREVQPQLSPEADYLGLRDRVQAFNTLNPWFDVYLLGSDGSVVEEFVNSGQPAIRKVALEALQAYFAPDAFVAAPIWGTNPRDPKEHRAVFSAAPVRIAASDGYLYIVLRNRPYELLSETGDIVTVLKRLGPFFGTVLGLSIVLSWLGFFQLTRPLRKVARSFHDYTRSGTMDHLPVRSNDEFGDIAHAFNAMSDQIASQIAELQRKDAKRRELIEDVAHDLRGPIATVSGYVELLTEKDETLSSSRRKEVYDTITHGMGSLHELLSDLFQLGQLEAADLQLHFAPFSLPELLEDLRLTYRLKVESLAIHLDTEYLEDLPEAFGDTRFLSRVLKNLIENALRYTPAGGTVMLSAAENGDMITVEVRDTGQGISAEDLPKIFSRAYQSKEQQPELKGLAGIGLAIVQKIVEAHGGEVSVRSQVGAGTAFAFTVPKARETGDIPT